MANLLSPGTPFAGLYGPNAVLSATGSPVISTPVTVYQSDGTTVAALWTNQTKATAASNPVNTDAYGNLTFYADPGIYVLSVSISSVITTFTVQVNPFYPDAAWNVVVDTGSASPLSGDCRLANASSSGITETLPAPTLGNRLRIAKTDSSTNAVTVTTPSGSILGPNLGAGVTSFPLSTQGAYLELFADGTNYHITSGGGGSGNVVSSYITSNMALSAGTTSLTSVSLVPGIWLITGSASVDTTGAITLFLGPTSNSSTGAYFGTWGQGNAGMTTTGSVAITATTTIYLEAYVAASTTIQATTAGESVPNATGIVAVQVG